MAGNSVGRQINLPVDYVLQKCHVFENTGQFTCNPSDFSWHIILLIVTFLTFGGS